MDNPGVWSISMFDKCLSVISFVIFCLIKAHCRGSWKSYRKQFLDTVFMPYYLLITRWSNISNMRCSVSSPDETPRRELKKRRAAEYFWRTSRCFIWWWNTVLDITSQTKSLLTEELRMQKWAVFHLISKHSLNINFLCIFLMNY